MFKTYAKIFTGNSAMSVEKQTNDWAEEHNSEIISVDLEYIPGGAVAPSIVFLTVVFKEKK